MLYLECDCNHTSASCFCAHSPLWGGAEGARGRSELHCTNFSTICTGSRLCLFWRDASARIARIFSVAQWPNGKQVSCPALQVIQRVKKREMFTHQGLLFKMWILAILQHPQMHHQFKRQRQRRLTDFEKKTGAWRNNWNKFWVCSLEEKPILRLHQHLVRLWWEPRV